MCTKGAVFSYSNCDILTSTDDRFALACSMHALDVGVLGCLNVLIGPPCYTQMATDYALSRGVTAVADLGRAPYTGDLETTWQVGGSGVGVARHVLLPPGPCAMDFRLQVSQSRYNPRIQLSLAGLLCQLPCARVNSKVQQHSCVLYGICGRYWTLTGVMLRRTSAVCTSQLLTQGSCA